MYTYTERSFILDFNPLHDLQHILDNLIEELFSKASLYSPPIDAEALVKAKAWQLLGCEAPFSNRKKNAPVFDGAESENAFVKHQWQAAQFLASAIQKEAKIRWEKLNDLSTPTGFSFINFLAQRILVPTHWFNPLASKMGHDLLQLKNAFNSAAYEIIALRMLDLEAPCIITIVDNCHVSKRKSNCCNPSKTLHPVENMVLDYVHENSRPKKINDQGWQVTGWPVHQLDWRREILRSIPPESPD